MKPSKDLFKLIRSLSQGEKWHFKKYATVRPHGMDNNYIRLFNVIAEQKNYDEEAWHLKFSGEKTANQLAVTKSNLYYLLLESLTVHHARKSLQQKILQQLYAVEILYNKRLFNQARRLLKKTGKVVGYHDFPLEKMKLLRWERVLMDTGTPPGWQEKRVNELGETEDRLIENYKLDCGYKRLIRKLNLRLNQYGIPRNAREMDKYKPLFDYLLAQREPKQTSPMLRFNHLSAMSIYYLVHGELEQAYDNYVKIVALLERYQEELSEDRTVYYITYTDQVSAMLFIGCLLGRADRYFEKQLEKLALLEEQLPPDLYEGLAPVIFIKYNSVRLVKHYTQAQFAEGQKVAAEIESKLVRFTPHFQTLVMVDLFMALGALYFCTGQFDKALEHFSKVLSNPRATSRQDIYGWAKIYSIIIHFELGNERVLEYSIKSAYHFLLSASRLHRSEKLLLQFFRKEVSHIHDETSLIAALKKLYKRLLKFKDGTYEKQMFSYHHLLYWLESWITRKSLPQVVKEKINN